MSVQRAQFDERLRSLIDLVDELIELIGAENRELETGVPSALSRSTAQKARLGAELDSWVRQVRLGQFNLAVATPALRQQLTARAEVLDEAIKENMVRLRSGIDATRSRVDAIMRAIREQTVREGSYDASGRRARTAPMPSSLLA
ncbi:flagellar protein FlgN [Devosia riboflavina]